MELQGSEALRPWLKIWKVMGIGELEDGELPVLPTVVLDASNSSDLDGTLYIFPLIFRTKLKPFGNCYPFFW